MEVIKPAHMSMATGGIGRTEIMSEQKKNCLMMTRVFFKIYEHYNPKLLYRMLNTLVGDDFLNREKKVGTTVKVVDTKGNKICSISNDHVKMIEVNGEKMYTMDSKEIDATDSMGRAIKERKNYGVTIMQLTTKIEAKLRVPYSSIRLYHPNGEHIRDNLTIKLTEMKNHTHSRFILLEPVEDGGSYAEITLTMKLIPFYFCKLQDYASSLYFPTRYDFDLRVIKLKKYLKICEKAKKKTKLTSTGEICEESTAPMISFMFPKGSSNMVKDLQLKNEKDIISSVLKIELIMDDVLISTINGDIYYQLQKIYDMKTVPFYSLKNGMTITGNIRVNMIFKSLPDDDVILSLQPLFVSGKMRKLITKRKKNGDIETIPILGMKVIPVSTGKYSGKNALGLTPKNLGDVKLAHVIVPPDVKRVYWQPIYCRDKIEIPVENGIVNFSPTSDWEDILQFSHTVSWTDYYFRSTYKAKQARLYLSKITSEENQKIQKLQHEKKWNKIRKHSSDDNNDEDDEEDDLQTIDQYDPFEVGTTVYCVVVTGISNTGKISQSFSIN